MPAPPCFSRHFLGSDSHGIQRGTLAVPGIHMLVRTAGGQQHQQSGREKKQFHLQIILIAGDYGWKQNLRLFPPEAVSKRKIPPFPPVHAVSRRENHAASELHPGQIIGFPVRRLFLRREKQPVLPSPCSTSQEKPQSMAQRQRIKLAAFLPEMLFWRLLFQRLTQVHPGEPLK